MGFPAASATNNRRAGIFFHAFLIMKPNDCFFICMNRVGCVTNFEHRHIRNFIWGNKMPITFKTFFAVFLAWLNPDQADFKAGIFSWVESQFTRDLHTANYFSGSNIIKNLMPGSDNNFVACLGDFF